MDVVLLLLKFKFVSFEGVVFGGESFSFKVVWVGQCGGPGGHVNVLLPFHCVRYKPPCKS